MGVHNVEHQIALSQNVFHETAPASNIITLRDDYPYNSIVLFKTTTTTSVVVKEPTVPGLRVILIDYSPAGTEVLTVTNAGSYQWLTSSSANILFNAAGEWAIIESIPDASKTSLCRWVLTSYGGGAALS